MLAKCPIDSPEWGENGMTDEQAGTYYAAMDYCEMSVPNFVRMTKPEQTTEIILQMLRMFKKNIKPQQQHIERAQRVQELNDMQAKQIEIFKNMKAFGFDGF